jgi:spore germination protein YaaH
METIKIKFLMLLYIMILFCHDESLSEGKKTASWGYLLHTSSMTTAQLDETIGRFDVICITGFKLTDAGTMRIESSRLLKTIASLAKKHHITIYPLISFQSTAQGHRILNSEAFRKKSAKSISEMARINGFTGIHLDFEYLPPEDAPRLGEFLVDLRREFSGKITMAVFPALEFPEKWSRFHDLKLMSPLLDEAVIMCYDFHGTHTGPGPVTDIGWAEKNIRQALKFIKADRLWLGVPAYGYQWCNGRVRALSAREGTRLSTKYAYKRDSSGTLHLEYQISDTPCSAYISDKHTHLLLKNLAASYGLAGTALWRISFED